MKCPFYFFEMFFKKRNYFNAVRGSGVVTFFAQTLLPENVRKLFVF